MKKLLCSVLAISMGVTCAVAVAGCKKKPQKTGETDAEVAASAINSMKLLYDKTEKYEDTNYDVIKSWTNATTGISYEIVWTLSSVNADDGDINTYLEVIDSKIDEDYSTVSVISLPLNDIEYYLTASVTVGTAKDSYSMKRMLRGESKAMLPSEIKALQPSDFIGKKSGSYTNYFYAIDGEIAQVLVKGYVVDVGEYSSSGYNKIYIADEYSETVSSDAFYVYKVSTDSTYLKGNYGDLELGDLAIFSGFIQNYVSNGKDGTKELGTLELTYYDKTDAQCVSLKKADYFTDAQAVAAAKKMLVISEDTFTETTTLTLPTKSCTANIAWEIAANDYVSVSGGTLTINKIPATSAEFELKATISRGSETAEAKFTINVLNIPELGEGVQQASLSFKSTDARETWDTNSQVWSMNGIKFTNNKASSSSNVVDSSNPVRLYSSSNVLIEKEGMVRIVLHSASADSNNDYAGNLANSLKAAGYNYVRIGDDFLILLDEEEPIESLEFTCKGQCRLNSVDVYTVDMSKVHKHVWEEYTYDATNGWQHTKVCKVDGCKYEGVAQTEDCVPVLNKCPDCGHEYIADEIVDALYKLASGASLKGTYKLTGVVTEITEEYNEQYGNITFSIEVAGKKVVAFRAKTGDSNTDYAKTVKVNDTVTVTGSLTNYDGKQEFNSGCLIIDLVEFVDNRNEEEKVEAALDAVADTITVYRAGVTKNLATSTVEGVEFTWEVKAGETPSVTVTISADYKTISVSALPAADEEVKLLVTAVCGNVTSNNTKVVTLTIKAAPTLVAGEGSLSLNSESLNVIDEDAESDYEKYNGAHTVNGYTFSTYQVMANTNNDYNVIQFQANVGELAVKGEFAKIVLVFESTYDANNDGNKITVKAGSTTLTGVATTADSGKTSSGGYKILLHTVTYVVTTTGVQTITLIKESAHAAYLTSIEFLVADGEHLCTHICPVCSKCTSECDDTVCDDKCPTHSLPETNFPTTSITDINASVPNAGNNSTEKYYAIGLVKSVEYAYSTKIYIQDLQGNELYIYGLYNENGSTRIQAAPAVGALKAGDAIVVYGQMTNYNGTKEMKDAWLVQVNTEVKTDAAQVLLAEITLGGNVTEDFTLPTADGKIKWDVTEGTGIVIETSEDGKTATAKVTRTGVNQPVKLTAKANVNGITAEKTFNVTVQYELAGQQEIELTSNALGLAKSYVDGNGTINGVAFTWKEFADYGDGIQMRTNTNVTPNKPSTLWNTQAFDYNIFKVEFTWSETKDAPTKDKNLIVEFADNAEFTDAKEEIITFTTKSVILVPDGAYTYIRITHNNQGAVYLSKINILCKVPTGEDFVAAALGALSDKLPDVIKAENVTLPESTISGVTFTWESDSDVYTISENGKQLVVSALPEDEDKPVTLTATAHYGDVSENNTKTVTVLIKQKTGGTDNLTEHTLTYKDLKSENVIEFGADKGEWSYDGITVTQQKSGSTNVNNSYDPITAGSVRWYANHIITIAYAGSTIKELEFECDSSSYATALKNSLASLGNVSISSNTKVTLILTTASESINFTLTAQSRVKSITARV